MSKKQKTTVSIDGGPEVDFDRLTESLQNSVAGMGANAVGNHLLRAMAANGARDLIRAIAEGEAEILDDIQQLRADAEEDAALKFKITLGVTLDLDKSTVDTAFGYSIKKSVKHSHAVSSPDVQEFDFEGGEG